MMATHSIEERVKLMYEPERLSFLYGLGQETSDHERGNLKPRMDHTCQFILVIPVDSNVILKVN